MSALRVLVVDDEPIARRGMRLLCEAEADLDVVGECGDGASAVAAIVAERPDLVLLDVQMPGMDGFEVLRATPAPLPIVVFVTAFDQFAVRAFEVHALDFLLKPFDDARFAAAIARAREARRAPGAGDTDARLRALLDALERGAIPAVPESPRLTRFVVRDRDRTILVKATDIDWIEAADYYSALHVGGRRLLVRETMASLERRLDPASFFRTHRSAIVNLDRVREIQPWFKGEYVVLLAGDARVRLSRSRRERLEAMLGQSL